MMDGVDPSQNHGEAVYIISTECCISSTPQELYIIKPQKDFYTRLWRDDIPPDGG